jgi:HEAT repeat protein
MLRITRTAVICILYIFISFSLFSQERSLEEQRKRTLAFGIDSEVVELIISLKNQEDTSLVDEMADLLRTTSSNAVRKEIFDFFNAMELDNGLEAARDDLYDWDLLSREHLTAVITYVGNRKDADSMEYLFELLEHDENPIVAQVLIAIGKAGDNDDAEQLIELLDDNDFPDILKPELIRTLGSLGAESQREKLEDILLNENEDPEWRRAAATALGGIHNEASLSAFRRVFQEKDTLLRSQIVTALSRFENEEAETLLMQALRDSFWRVRVAAAKSLGDRKSTQAVDILIYKAESDPEANVKQASFDALIAIGNADSVSFLVEYYANTKNPERYRIQLTPYLVENQFAQVKETIDEVLEKEWEKDRSLIIESIAKTMSLHTNSGYAPYLGQFLDHKSLTLKIYAIRGIEKNNLAQYRERLESLAEEDGPLKRYAASAVDSF